MRMKSSSARDHAGFAQGALEGSCSRAAGTRSSTSARTTTESTRLPRLRRGGRRARWSSWAGEARGVCVCGTGIGISIAANKVPGVRAALVSRAARRRGWRAQHNDANVICFGERLIGPARRRGRAQGVPRDAVRGRAARAAGRRSSSELEQVARDEADDAAQARARWRCAARGRTTARTRMVGCVIVRGGQGRSATGWHHQAGRRSRRGRRRCASSAWRAPRRDGVRDARAVQSHGRTGAVHRAR